MPRAIRFNKLVHFWHHLFPRHNFETIGVKVFFYHELLLVQV